MSRPKPDYYYGEFKKQRKFLQALSSDDKEQLDEISEAYGQGDQLSEEEHRFIEKIFENIPPLTETALVYRGIEKLPVTSETIIFTTIDQSWACNFIDHATGNYLLEITIPIGTKIIPWSDVISNHNEREVLLNGNTNYLAATGNPTRTRIKCGDVMIIPHTILSTV